MNLKHNIFYKDKENRRILILSTAYSIIAFTWLKIQYPFPNFLPDSYSYLDAAFKNQSINMWPIGYSMFLRLFSTFTRSDTALVTTQYLFLQAGILYFLLSLKYLLNPGKWLFRIITICCICNPLSLYLSNFISSDALFASLSLIWLTQLLRILYRPNANLLVFHAFILLFAFMVRYNALYYPFISIVVVLFTRMRFKLKTIAIGVILLLVGGFIAKNIAAYKKQTQIAEFSGFSGWQLASNALFAYAHSTVDPSENVPAKFRTLHAMTTHHMDSLKRLPTRPDSELGIYYLWDEHAPLKAYLHEKWKKDTTTDGFAKWASMSPLYSAYGGWLIKEHPLDFLRYYCWPNMINYYAPSPEFMNIYNMKKDSTEDVAQSWFGYKTKKLTFKSKDILVTNIFPVILAVVNLLFILCLISFWILDGFRKSTWYFSKALRWVLLIWFANLGFSVFASPVVLRYQAFPMIFTFSFLGFLLGFLIKESINSKQATSISKYEKHNGTITDNQLSGVQ